MRMSAPSWKRHLPVDWRFLVEESNAIIGISQSLFVVLKVLIIFQVWKPFRVVESLKTRLLCLVGELAGGGSVAVDVGVSDKRQASGNR